MSRFLQFLAFGVLLVVSSCSGGGEGSDTNVRGILGPLAYSGDDPRLTSVPSPSNLRITVRGRNEAEFPVTFFQEPEIPGTLSFQMNGLPSGESLVFRITGGGLEDISTFPIVVDPNRHLYLTSVPTGIVDEIATQAAEIVLPGSTQPPQIDLNDRGAILGVISPEGSSCAGISAVSLLDRSGAAVAVTGPYYFNSDGSLRLNGFGDPQCNYIIFNVPPGDYDVRFVRSNGSDTRVTAVVLEGVVTVGYKIPES